VPFISPDVIHHFNAGTQPVLPACYYNSCEVNAAGITQYLSHHALLLLCSHLQYSRDPRLSSEWGNVSWQCKHWNEEFLAYLEAWMEKQRRGTRAASK